MATEDLSDDALWKRITVDLQSLSEVHDASQVLTASIERGTEGSAARLLSLHAEALQKSQEEKTVILRALDNVSKLLGLRDRGDATFDLKRKKRGIESETLQQTINTAATNNINNNLGSTTKKARRYSSTAATATDSNNNIILQPGQQVAAKTPKEKGKSEEWILARVVRFLTDKNKYLVEDDEEDPDDKRATYTLPIKSLIAIADEDEVTPEFPKGHTILALYPQTTCFYKAIVLLPPSLNKGSYSIKFDDDNDHERTAPPRMVLDMPKLK